MAMTSQFPRTVVFDLDDTLYDECTYVKSGKRAVGKLLEKLYGIDASDILLDTHQDFIGFACRKFGLSDASKDSLLWAYRLHRPSISLRPGVVDLWRTLRQAGAAICILTDGREITQRLKVDALGLDPDGLFTSESVGSEKPSPRGYQLIEARYPSCDYIYIADNPKKDFVAPQRLGWRTFGIRPSLTSIHVGPGTVQLDFVQPQIWVNDFAELLLHFEAK